MDQLIPLFSKPNKELKSEMIMDYLVQQIKTPLVKQLVLFGVWNGLYLAFMSKEIFLNRAQNTYCIPYIILQTAKYMWRDLGHLFRSVEF
jgi:hypothetical protein